MFTDIVGYTSLTQRDESSTLQALEKHRSLLRPLFTSHGGREIKTIGDAFLVEFQSALDAVLCAVAVQQIMHDRKVARGEQLTLRIGIHVGDVVESGNDILGDAVNIASRIEPLAEPGEVCISGQVYDQVRNKSDLLFVSLGEKALKNVSTPVIVYAVRMPWGQTASDKTQTYATDRIAILPFRNMSPDPDDEYFAEGITEEIISTVSGISGLNVISRTSVMHYKRTEKTVKEIGRELEVGSVLEGSLRKAGNRIRVTTQLIDVVGDRHLWAQNYDRNLDDIFAVQSDVAKQVADALKVRILSPEKQRIEMKPTESTVAYTLYLKGRYHWNKRGIGDVTKAIEYFQLAVHEDQRYALGYDGLCDCHRILASNWNLEIEANLEKAKQYVARALELDPDLAEGHASRAGLLMGDYEWPLAEEAFKKAIEMKPSYASVHHWYFLLLLAQERMSEALSHIQRAAELDPLSPVINLEHGYYYLVKGDYMRAAQLYETAAELDPKSAIARGYLANVYARMGRLDDTRREAGAYVALVRDSYPMASTGMEAFMAWASGDKEKLRRLLPALESHLKETGTSALDMATNYFFLGENDKGFEWLEKSFSNKEFFVVFSRTHDFLDGVRKDPRYLSLLKRLGLE
jgi:TolB-like protein